MFETLLYYIKTSWRWLMRCRYSRGFGIQSPSAYSFVCNVVNNHHVYDCYDELQEEMSNHSKTFRKLGMLFCRLAYYWQPQYVVMGDYDFASYVYAGHPSTLVRMIDDYYFADEPSSALVILDIDWLDDDNLLNELLDSARENLLLVVMGIYKNKHNRKLWHDILADERCGVTYDLYSCAIIFFDKSKYKQIYKINF